MDAQVFASLRRRCGPVSVAITMLARSRRPVRDGEFEDVEIYATGDGTLWVYGGVYYPHALSTIVNTGGSQPLDPVALLADPVRHLPEYAVAAWNELRDAERQRVLEWARTAVERRGG